MTFVATAVILQWVEGGQNGGGSVLALREARSAAHPSAQRGQTEGHASQPEEEAPCDSSLFSLVIMMEMQPFSPPNALQR